MERGRAMAIRARPAASGLFLLFLTFATWFSPSLASSSDHKYAKGDLVPLYVNKIGPFQNPTYVFIIFLLVTRSLSLSCTRTRTHTLTHTHTETNTDLLFYDILNICNC